MPPRPRAHIDRLQPYAWEAMASDVAERAGIAESQVVRFDTNTSSWPPVAWEQTVLDLPRLAANEYPHPSNEPLRSALAERMQVTPDQVVVTCGADEALSLLAAAYLGPDRIAVAADPTFSMFRVVTEATGAALHTVPLAQDWSLPRAALLDAVANPRVGVVWLCSPSNPTGGLVPAELVQEVLTAAPEALVCLDEAYAEINGQTLAPMVLASPNGVVVRTFSKGYGLAGARVGYLVAQPAVARVIESIRLPQNLTAFGIAAAMRALADQAGLQTRVCAIVEERTQLSGQLERRGWQVLPSHANFVLGRPPRPADAVADWLQGAGLIVRTYAGHPRLDQWLRITVRSPEENARLLARLDAAP